MEESSFVPWTQVDRPISAGYGGVFALAVDAEGRQVVLLRA